MRGMRGLLAWAMVVGGGGVASAQDAVPADAAARWWKGNLHTHTFWSDGNDFPEMVGEWYRTNGYNFLALSDHNVMSQGERWMELSEIERRSRGGALGKYLDRFGADWVEMRTNPGTGLQEVRLQQFEEYAALLEERGRFIMIPAEEITSSFERLPVHINAANLAGRIAPISGESVEDVIRRTMRAVEAHAAERGRVVLAHLNHPNFGYGVTAEDFARVVKDRFFEVFNGHTGVNNHGDGTRAGMEEVWDIVSTIRIAELGVAPIMGIATDDSHSYHDDSPVSIPGRGWVMVRATHLTPGTILEAMHRGDFYASTGVELESVAFEAGSEGGNGRLTVVIAGEEGVSYTTRFVGTRRGVDLRSEPRVDASGAEVRATRRYSDAIGEVFAEVEGTRAAYTLAGDELYVRAVVVSSAAPERPTRESVVEMAWTQPVGWGRWVGEGEDGGR
ncbi:MAG: hypothetical protein R3B68_07275 [Phycisphaerales bacterium]